MQAVVFFVKKLFDLKSKTHSGNVFCLKFPCFFIVLKGVSKDIDLKCTERISAYVKRLEKSKVVEGLCERFSCEGLIIDVKLYI